MYTFKSVTLTFTTIALLAGAAVADEVVLGFSPPTNLFPAPCFVTIGGQTIPVLIPGPVPVEIKRQLILDQVRLAGHDADLTPHTNNAITIHTVPHASRVAFSGGMTGERADSARAPRILVSGIDIVGRFDPFDADRLPAVFTAGIVTDVGELATEVSAQELNFQTDGPIICQALFQRLAPRAPQFGAQINFAGDRLEVYFDPAYTVTQGGVIFGTTSPTQGFGGHIDMPPALPRCVSDVDDGTFTGTPDGGTTIDDLLYYLYLFEIGDARADVDDGSGSGTVDGGVTIDDLLYYLLRFEQGC
jgi:hypothetical protein